MERKQQLQVGTWWHFDRYEFRDGYIRPAVESGGRCYEPWDEYERSKQDTNYTPPYVELFRLLDDLGFKCEIAGPSSRSRIIYGSDLDTVSVVRPTPGSRRASGSRFTPKQLEALENWCSRWGLLGVLPNRVQSMVVRARSSNELLRDARFVDGVSDPSPGVFSYQVTNGEWTLWDGVGSARHRDTSASSTAVEPMEPQAFEPSHYGSNFRSLKDAVWPFFPCVPESDAVTYEYPAPLSREFWKQYAEPVDKFFYTAELLRDAVYGISPVMVEAQHKAQGRARTSRMNALFLSPIGQQLADDGQALTIKWNFPSLVSSLAMMAVQDAMGGCRLLRCAECSSVFVTDAYQATYCSQRCAWKHRQKRARERKASTASEERP